MANQLQRTQPSIMPAIPEALKDKAHFGSRTINQHHIDTGVGYSDTYMSTGLFPNPVADQTDKSCFKAQSAFFDMDLNDVLCSEDDFSRAMDFFNQRGITQVFKTSSGKQIQLADVEFGARDKNWKDVIKAWLTHLSADDLISMIEATAETFADQLIALIGKPNLITYSGTGFHMHYFISSAEGWTEIGAEAAGVGPLVDCNRIDFQNAYKRLIAYIANRNNGITFDKQCSDVGLRVTRAVGSVNSKCSNSKKQVVAIWTDKCDADRALKLVDFDVVKEEPRRSAKRSARQSVKDVKGNDFDRRIKRLPARLSQDETVTYESNGREITLTVEELKQQWEDLKAQGIVFDDKGDKIKVRLDWLSNGSINCMGRMTDEGSLLFICDVDKYLDASDRHVHETEGKLIGLWVYEGSLQSQLRMSEKGALLAISHNFQILLQLDPRTKDGIRLNTRTEEIEVSAAIHQAHQPGNAAIAEAAKVNSWFTLNDKHLLYIKMVIETFYSKSISKDDILGAVEMVAGMQCYDDVKAWVESIQWDGKRRLDGDDAWLCDFMGISRAETELFAYYEFVGRNWINAMVRNIFAIKSRPVATQHMALMRGPQNFGKSTLAQVLAATNYIGHRYYGELGDRNLLNKGAGDMILALRGKTCVEIPELAAFSKKEADLIKNFITQEVLEGRLAYGRLQTRMEKNTYLVGTTNKFKPLNDPTGNRRFQMIDFYNDYRRIPTSSKHLWDMPALIALVPQLYAEAYQRVVLGQHIPAERQAFTTDYCGTIVEKWNLTSDELVMLNTKNMSYTNQNAVTESVYDILENLVGRGVIHISLAAIRKSLKDDYHITVNSNNAINEALAERNWKKKRVAGQRVFEYQGAVSAEAEARSITFSAAEAAATSAKDVAKTGDNTATAGQMAELMAMVADLRNELGALRRENTQLKAELKEATAVRVEPRRRRSTSKKKAAPAPVAVAEAETDAPLTIEAALKLLRDNGQGHKADRYESVPADQESRKKVLAASLIEAAEELRV